MKLPPNVIIARDKLTRYLLVAHPENDKSAFLALAGYTSANPDALEAAIRELVATYDAVWERRTPYGDFYRVAGILKQAGDGRDLSVVTVWIVRTDEVGSYRFVTLIPRGGSPMHPELYTRVVLTRDIPAAHLKAGDTAIYIEHLPVADGEAGAILEVFNALGETLAVVTVPLSAIETPRANYIPAVRVWDDVPA